MPPQRLFRGGAIDRCSHESLQRPCTVLNLRQGPDPTLQELGWPLGVALEQIAASNALEKYDTSLPEVRAWLTNVACFLADPTTRWPVLIHCRSGRDRTGIVCAMCCKVLGVPPPFIMDEFSLSTEADRGLMERSLAGFGDSMDRYFRGNARTQTGERAYAPPDVATQQDSSTVVSLLFFSLSGFGRCCAVGGPLPGSLGRGPAV